MKILEKFHRIAAPISSYGNCGLGCLINTGDIF